MNLKHPYYNYYYVDEKRYSTRLTASIASSKFLKNIQWYLPNFEIEFDKLNILNEPIENLSELYKKRAEELRDEYDYIILHYSGGHDSHNILETFIFNDIFIDEILILDQFDKTFRSKLENENFEYLHLNGYEAELSAIPLAKHFIETYSPKTKLTIVENSFNIHAEYWKKLSEKEIIKNLRYSGTLGVIGKTPIRTKNLNLYNFEYKKLKETKKVVHLWGRDKTSVKFDEIGYYFSFDDGSFTDYIDVNNLITDENIPQEVEFFYTHPSTSKMILKQAHLIMNNLPFYKINNKFSTRAKEDLLASIIYDRKIKTKYQALKPGDFLKNKDSIKKDSGDLNFYNFAELDLIKNHDIDITKNFNLQTNILKTILNCSFEKVQDIISQNYSTKKFYIKYFE